MGSDGYSFVGLRASGPARLTQSLCSATRDRPGQAGIRGGQGARIMRVRGGLGRAGAEHHAHQRGFGELEIHSNPSPTKLNFVGLGLENIEWVLTDLEATIIVEANVSLRVVVV